MRAISKTKPSGDFVAATVHDTFNRFEIQLLQRRQSIARRKPALQIMKNALLSSTLLATLFLTAGCQKDTPAPSCKQTLETTVVKGQNALESINGLQLKDTFPVFECTSRPYSENPADNKYVARGLEYLHWYQGELYDNKTTAPARAEGYATIVIEIQFGARQARPDWWYSPALPHTLYPIDLLPNFGREAPVTDAAIQPLKDTDSIYWKVRGARQDVTRCDIQPRQDAGKSDRSSLTEPNWLIRGETEVRQWIGNTCRGHVMADNNKPLAHELTCRGAR